MTLTEYIARGYESITPFQAAAGLGLAVLFVLYLFLRDTGLPPGPTGLPLLGYWPFLSPDTSQLQLQKLQRKYGDLFCFRFAGRLFVCLGSHKLLSEADLSACFRERPQNSGVMSHVVGGGIDSTNWKRRMTLRKFFLRKFIIDYGITGTKGHAVECLHDATEKTVRELKSMGGRPVNVWQFFSKKCTSVMNRVLFKDEGFTDEEMKEVTHAYGFQFPASLTSTNMMLLGNFAKYFIYPFVPRYRAMVRSHKRIEAIVRNVINRNRSSYRNPLDRFIDSFFFIGSFFMERDERQRRGDSTAQHFTDKSLMMFFYQFVTGGVITVSYFIGSYLQALADHPEEQEKIYNELMKVVGPDRTPTVEYKSKLPYTNAFIHEVLRHSDILPIFPSGLCTYGTTLNGYRIPAGAITLMNIWSIHHDPNAYENPDKFDPSRYISTPGKPKAELPIVFGVGTRSCVGETFTMIEIFLFVTAIVKNFRLSLPEGSERSSTLFFQQGTLEICFHPRSQKNL